LAPISDAGAKLGFVASGVGALVDALNGLQVALQSVLLQLGGISTTQTKNADDQTRIFETAAQDQQKQTIETATQVQASSDDMGGAIVGALKTVSDQAGTIFSGILSHMGSYDIHTTSYGKRGGYVTDTRFAPIYMSDGGPVGTDTVNA